MKDKHIDDVLKQAAGASPPVDPALLNRISGSIGASLQPVRPLPPVWILVMAAAIVCAAVASAGGALLGLHGIQKMTAAEIGLIFPALGIVILFAATVSVSEMIPGSRHLMSPSALLVAACVIFITIFALLFHDYSTERFVPQGIACLKAGLILAVPAAVLTWLILRRGFAANSLAAGAAQGTLAGLAGVGMLELHCPNFETFHVMVWHTAVLPLSAAAGALLVWISRSLRRN
jgi:hypothetical protein